MRRTAGAVSAFEAAVGMPAPEPRSPGAHRLAVGHTLAKFKSARADALGQERMMLAARAVSGS